MTDIEIARKILKEENLTLALVKGGEVVFKSREKGIKPMFILATEFKELGKEASLADRVTGKAAALLSVYIGIKELYADLISQGAIEILEETNISYSSGKTCSYIRNRDKTDYCPMEKLSLDLEDPLLLIDRIKDFFESIRK